MKCNVLKDLNVNCEKNNSTIKIILTFCTFKVRHARCKPKRLLKILLCVHDKD